MKKSKYMHKIFCVGGIAWVGRCHKSGKVGGAGAENQVDGETFERVAPDQRRNSFVAIRHP